MNSILLFYLIKLIVSFESLWSLFQCAIEEKLQEMASVLVVLVFQEIASALVLTRDVGMTVLQTSYFLCSNK